MKQQKQQQQQQQQYQASLDMFTEAAQQQLQPPHQQQQLQPSQQQQQQPPQLQQFHQQQLPPPPQNRQKKRVRLGRMIRATHQPLDLAAAGNKSLELQQELLELKQKNMLLELEKELKESIRKEIQDNLADQHEEIKKMKEMMEEMRTTAASNERKLANHQACIRHLSVLIERRGVDAELSDINRHLKGGLSMPPPPSLPQKPLMLAPPPPPSAKSSVGNLQTRKRKLVAEETAEPRLFCH